jgi:hypothetical protein
MRPALRAALGALLILAAVGPAVASAQSPALRVHAIFSGGQAKNFHVGQALQVAVRDAGGRKLTQVCMTPAPIARPACSTATILAPSAVGPTTVQATLADGTKLTQTFTALAPATKVGGSRAVPGRDAVRQLRPPPRALARPVRGREEGHARRALQLHRPREDLHVGLRDQRGRVRDAGLRADDFELVSRNAQAGHGHRRIRGRTTRLDCLLCAPFHRQAS